MSKITSEHKELGKLKAATDKGRRICSNGHLYIRKKNKVWKELC